MHAFGLGPNLCINAHFAVAKTINYENNYPCGRYDAGLSFGLILRSGCR